MSNRDTDEIRKRLAPWLEAHIAGARALEITNLAVPVGVGHSAISYLIDTAYSANGVQRLNSFALRGQVVGGDFFLGASLDLPWKMMDAMSRHSDVPVPKLLGIEYDTSVLGFPFLVMYKVEGRVPPQQTNLHQAGWLFEASSAERAKAWRNALETIAHINTLDWRKGFRFLDDSARGAPGFDQYLKWVEDWYAWAAGGRAFPIPEAALDYLRKNKPAATTPCVLWGDAQPSNVMFGPDMRVAAVLDWEMAALGTGEVDLGWWLYQDELITTQVGVKALDGMPSRAESVAIYEAAAGCKVRDVEYYEVLAALRMAIVMIRAVDRMVEAGKVKTSNASGRDNPMTAALAIRLGRTPPKIGEDWAAILEAYRH